MPNAEPTGWIPQLVAGLGLSSTFLGAWMLRIHSGHAVHDSRLDKLEEQSVDAFVQIRETHTSVTRLETTTERTSADVSRILDLVERRGGGID